MHKPLWDKNHKYPPAQKSLASARDPPRKLT